MEKDLPDPQLVASARQIMDAPWDLADDDDALQQDMPLYIAWFALGKDSASQQAQRITAEDRVTVSQDDARFRVTVTAQRPRDFVPASLQADAQRTTGSNSQRT